MEERKCTKSRYCIDVFNGKYMLKKRHDFNTRVYIHLPK